MKSSSEMAMALRRRRHRNVQQSRRRPVLLSLALSAAAALFGCSWLAFSAPGSLSPRVGRQPRQVISGKHQGGASHVATSATATATWFGTGQKTQDADGLSPRGWIRLYRTLGIPEDSTRDQVLRATTKLRKKYADDAVALERVEAANLMIMTNLVARKEAENRKRQNAKRVSDTLDTPRRLFAKYVIGNLPAGVQRMVEMPDSGHFKRASGLLGVFALLGFCVPTQATNFVGLGAASCLGLIYARSRPEPVKDDMGNAGAVQKLNMKEMGAACAVVIASALLSGGITFGLGYVLKEAPIQVIFCGTANFIFWLSALCFKVYGCFSEYQE